MTKNMYVRAETLYPTTSREYLPITPVPNNPPPFNLNSKGISGKISFREGGGLIPHLEKVDVTGISNLKSRLGRRDKKYLAHLVQLQDQSRLGAEDKNSEGGSEGREGFWGGSQGVAKPHENK